MGWFDDQAVVIGDWMPPSPSPRSLFSAVLGNDVSSKIISEPLVENKSVKPLQGTEEHDTLGSFDEKGGPKAALSPGQLTNSSTFSEQKMSSRGGLVERMAARAGFNAPRLNTESIHPFDFSVNQDVRSPSYLTISPGSSPTTLLESPVFLSNSLVLPSPTTGKFLFALSGNGKSSPRSAEAPDKSKDNFFEDIDSSSSSFAFKPVAASGLSLFPPPESIPHAEVSIQLENSSQSATVEFAEVQPQSVTTTHLQAGPFRAHIENEAAGKADVGHVGGSVENSSPLNEKQDEEAEQRSSGDTSIGGTPADDGYNWRKYGQKQVKGCEHPRSYYKCTHSNCLVKKQVERSHEGQITEIIYKGAHNHSKPPPNRRSATGSSSELTQMADQTVGQVGADGGPDWRQDNAEATSSPSLGVEYLSAPDSLQAQNDMHFDSVDMVDGSSTFSNNQDEVGQHGTMSLGYDDEGNEPGSKRRKIEAYATEMSGASRAAREPRVVVQTTSEVDVLDDGYRWRKYGQKVVKGNPNPRSYYKCTSAGCTVRKHVERASHDLRSVITTYEGKHNHDVPTTRNSSHVNSSTSATMATQFVGATTTASVQSHLQRQKPSQVQNGVARFDRSTALGVFGLPLSPPPHGFTFGMNQPGLANFAMAPFGPDHGKLPILPIPYLRQQHHPLNDMNLIVPTSELPKKEPSEASLNLPNGSSVYHHQLMSGMPLERQT